MTQPAGSGFPLIEVLAIYGSLVATWSLGWQIVRARREHRSHVQLKISWEKRAGDPEDIVVQVINFSSHPVKVKNWGFFAEGHGPQPQRYDVETPGLEIPGHDSIEIREDIPSALGDIDLVRERVVAWIQLTTGEEFTSAPTPSAFHHSVDSSYAKYEAEHGGPPAGGWVSKT